ncbi:MAG: ribosome recycling factor [Rhodanobacteraceae bacterium]|nr:MAG: ribosome recycling factor [Rhodanobacteraceae bacterium]
MLEDIKSDSQARMGKSVESLRHELSHLRTGRASTALLDGIKVPYYGSDVPLNQVATVTVSGARALTITPYEKTVVAAVEKAIMASDLGVTPTTAGMVIRLNMPPLTEERRRDLAKHVGREAESAKVAIRNIRRDALQQIKDLTRDKQISEDDERKAQDEMQKLTDRHIKDVDAAAQDKEQELLAL